MTYATTAGRIRRVLWLGWPIALIVWASWLGTVAAGSLRLARDDVGLKYEIDIDHDDPDHARVWPKIRSGIIRGSSFTFIPRKYRDERKDDKTIRRLEDVELIEVGPVLHPAYPATTAGVRSVSQDAVAARLAQIARLERSYEIWQPKQ